MEKKIFTLSLENHKFFFRKDKKGEEKALSPLLVSELLLLHSSLKNLRLYPSFHQSYLYDDSQGIYIQLNNSELALIVRKVLAPLKHPAYKDVNFVRKVVAQLEVSDNSYLGKPSIDLNKIVFSNGVLDLETKSFTEWSPSFFQTSKLSFNYDPSLVPNKFLEFLDSFCVGHQDRKDLIRAWFNALIFSRNNNQVFLSLLGMGATGKSTFATIATALVGKEATITVSLRSLHADNFEIINLINKKLILISDSEDYAGSLDILKQLVGGDALKGRLKYIQGAFEVDVIGLVLIVANQPIRARDTSALRRRQIIFRAENISSSRQSLLHFRDGLWQGPLTNELGGIFNWVLNFSPQQADRILQNCKSLVPSLADAQHEAEEHINPMLSWVRDELEDGEGSYVGYRFSEGPKSELENSRRKALYPAYNTYMRKMGLKAVGHNRFSVELLETLKVEGYVCAKERRELGVYIKGVRLKDSVFSRDKAYGAPLALSEGGEISNISLDTAEGFRASKVHPRLDQDLYGKYMSCLGKSPLKMELNKKAKELPLSVLELVLEDYTRQCKVKSEDFKQSALEVLSKGLTKIKKFGAIPYTYKPMGVSPRIIPVSYGETLNSVKTSLRNKTYEWISQTAFEKDYVICDVDLRSCYTSILLGLYPDHLQSLQVALENKGLWKFIEEEFKQRGKGHVFNKPAVKICVYSSFFLGGNRAMINGIMEAFRKDLGLTEPEFKVSSFYEECHTIAREVCEEMMNSSIINDFKSIASWLMKAYNNDYFEGPTGHSYLVNEHTFKTAYPNFLQSYEFALLAQATLETGKEFPKMEVIGHFHDGNVLALPCQEMPSILDFMGKKVQELGRDFGLRYPQKIEVKKSFGSLALSTEPLRAKANSEPQT